MSDSVKINPRKVPLKGEPDFTNVSDETLKEYEKLIQRLIFAYNRENEEVVKVLKVALKDISMNLTKRIKYDTISTESENSSSTSITVRKNFLKPKSIKIIRKKI